MSDPIEIAEMRQMLTDARREFARDVDALLEEIAIHGEALGQALGEVSREEALRALRQLVIAKFDQRLR